MERRPIGDTGGKSTNLPFDDGFQRSLLLLLTEDHGFACGVGKYIEPRYFESPVLAWAWHASQQYMETYGSPPSIRTILQFTRKLDAETRPVYEQVLCEVERAHVQDAEWLRAQTIDFVRKQKFIHLMHLSQAMWNAGKTDEVYAYVTTEISNLSEIAAVEEDEAFFFETFGERQARRLHRTVEADAIPTGLPTLDHVLDGGLSRGELGAWIAYAKCGKSTMLVNLGLACIRLGHLPVAHFVLEGMREQVETRYDAAFTEVVYNELKWGRLGTEYHVNTMRQYQFYQRKLMVRGMTGNWDYNILTIQGYLRRWQKTYGWIPKLIVVDYVDILGGRKERYPNETAKQTDAARDLKTLMGSGPGYMGWTAMQAQRPNPGVDEQPHLIGTSMVADAYAKIRIFDYLGSINRTNAEKRANVARLYGELYRDNEAGQVWPVAFDNPRMRIEEREGIVSPSVPPNQQRGLAPKQTWAPV